MRKENPDLISRKFAGWLGDNEAADREKRGPELFTIEEGGHHEVTVL